MPNERDFLLAIRDDPKNKEQYLVYADWLEECGRLDEAKLLRTYQNQDTARTAIARNKGIADNNWFEVFSYAGLENGCGSSAIEKALPNDDISTAPFAREDVFRVIAMDVGQNDGDNWLIAGELFDSRFFFISAGCDYSGWG